MYLLIVFVDKLGGSKWTKLQLWCMLFEGKSVYKCPCIHIERYRIYNFFYKLGFVPCDVMLSDLRVQFYTILLICWPHQIRTLDGLIMCRKFRKKVLLMTLTDTTLFPSLSFTWFAIEFNANAKIFTTSLSLDFVNQCLYIFYTFQVLILILVTEISMLSLCIILCLVD